MVTDFPISLSTKIEKKETIGSRRDMGFRGGEGRGLRGQKPVARRNQKSGCLYNLCFNLQLKDGLCLISIQPITTLKM